MTESLRLEGLLAFFAAEAHWWQEEIQTPLVPVRPFTA